MLRVVCALALAPVLCMLAGCYDIVEARDNGGTTGAYDEVTYDSYDSWYTFGYDPYDQEDYSGGGWGEEDSWVEDDWYYDQYTDEWCFYDVYYDAWYCGTDDYYDDGYGNGWYYDEYADTWCYYDAYYDEWYCDDGYVWP